jgi:hypothetical protein
MSELFLSVDELRQLTGRCRPYAQVKALIQMRVPFHLRPDGVPVVLRSALKCVAAEPARQDNEPDFSSLN